VSDTEEDLKLQSAPSKRSRVRRVASEVDEGDGFVPDSVESMWSYCVKGMHQTGGWCVELSIL